MGSSIQARLLPRWHPLVGLTLIFILWKVALILVALSSPGPGYDTSTTLLDLSNGALGHLDHPPGPGAVSKFVRWDAIYFIQIAQRGHVFEQEWAFSPGFTIDVSRAAQILFQTDAPTLWQIAVGGVALAHAAHYGSMLLMWSIASRITDTTSTHKESIPAIATLLYIFSPAGIFLSALSTEGVFALQSFLGVYLYITIWDGSSFLMPLIRTILAGGIFMRATITRSNGILAGILFAIDAIDSTLHTVVAGLDLVYLARLASSVVAGLLIGWGMVWPQLGPYADYCVFAPIEERREWCTKLVPSIYTFVQSHYWNVGLFRYWTMSNLPLFILATPSLWLLIFSASQCCPNIRVHVLRQRMPGFFNSLDRSILWVLALPQLVLALLALTSYHVQIITRLSSGYPVWYIWLAGRICDTAYHRNSKAVFRWMVLYATVQAGLYASFLPPA